MSDHDDRRDNIRAPIELKVEYKKLNTFFADYTKNICKGGTFIRTKKPLEVGTDLRLPAGGAQLKEPIAIRGEVEVGQARGPAVAGGRGRRP